MYPEQGFCVHRIIAHVFGHPVRGQQKNWSFSSTATFDGLKDPLISSSSSDALVNFIGSVYNLFTRRMQKLGRGSEGRLSPPPPPPPELGFYSRFLGPDSDYVSINRVLKSEE